MSTTVEIHTSEGPMSAVEYKAPNPKGAVLVVQEAFGLTEHIADVCRRFADEGYTAIAPAFFHREGSPIVSYGDMPSAMDYVGKLTADGIREDLQATLNYLEAQGFTDENIGCVGFCMGGIISFYAGTIRQLGATATFYGSVGKPRLGLPSLIEQVPSMKTSWIGFYGDQDQGIPVEDVEQMKAAIKSAAVTTEIHRYAEAGHGFHCDARPNNYNESAAKDAWAKTLTWFNANIKVPN